MSKGRTMKHLTLILALFVLVACTSEAGSLPMQGGKKHLFILSGQSNMAGLDPNISFTPTVEKAFGKENTLVVKDAVGGQPIRRWYKNYQYPDKREIKDKSKIGDLYDRLMGKVKAAMGDRKFDTVTFVWMQGERDAREALADVYAAAFKGIIAQLKQDLKKDTIYFVIGRISDYDIKNSKYKHWTRIRDVQVQLAREDKNGQWIDCDDLNDGKNRSGKQIKNDLHMSVEGYRKMGERFAEKAIALINGTAKNE